MKNLEVIPYHEFNETKYIANPDGSNSLIELPELSESNFIQLIDEHNLLVNQFIEFKQQVEENLNEIKQNIKQ
jgi:hypothetical protein